MEAPYSYARGMRSTKLYDHCLKRSYVVNCLKLFTELYDYSDFDIIIDPFVKDSHFFEYLPEDTRLGFDFPGTNKFEFFNYKHPDDKKILVIGQLPANKTHAITIEYFNYAALFASVIAVVVPCIFRRTYIQNKLSCKFHLVQDTDINRYQCPFKTYTPRRCCFQIWVKKNTCRGFIKLPLSHPDWEFIKITDESSYNNVSFAIRAYNLSSGQIVDKNIESLNINGWFFIKSNIDPTVLKERFLSLDFSSVVSATQIGSLTKKDIVHLYNKHYGSSFKSSE